MSDPAMLEAYRLQCEHAKRSGRPVEVIYLMWRGQRGTTDDDLIDVMKEVNADASLIPAPAPDDAEGKG